MLLPRAEALGVTHDQCLTLLERAEDTLHFLTSSLTFLICAEGKKALPDSALIAEWEALDQETIDLGYSLPGSDVNTYMQVIETFGQRHYDLRPFEDRYLKEHRTGLLRAM